MRRIETASRPSVSASPIAAAVIWATLSRGLGPRLGLSCNPHSSVMLPVGSPVPLYSVATSHTLACRVMRAASVRPGIEGSLIVIGLVLLTIAQDQRLGADGLARYDALRMLLEQGQLSDTIYSMIGPIFAAPVWLFGALAGDVDIWLRHYNVIIFALGIGLTYWML